MTKGIALVTGASSGIGAVYADRLAGRGHDLVLVARDTARLAALSGRIEREFGLRAEVLRADLGSPGGIAAVVQRLASDDRITMLVNAAGLGPRGSFLGSEPADLTEMVDLNVSALHDLTVAAAQSFSARKTGAIINIASAVALMPERFNATYVATKAFVLALTEALAADLAACGVTMQAVLPGFTRTEIFERAGISSHAIDPEMMMEADEMVEAALAGFDQGETVTIPSLQDPALWQALETSRQAMAPHLSRRSAAARFGVRPSLRARKLNGEPK